jgi:NodT family efflux transporter outer membrane factor (OMF) lipoprotein
MAAVFLALQGCSSLNEYIKPEVAVPADWSSEYPWRKINPSDHEAKGPWWEIFADSELNKFESAALESNPNLKISAARLEQAKATVTVANAGLYPQVDLVAGAARAKTSENRPRTSSSVAPVSTTQNDFILGLRVNYEADLFGRVSSEVRGAEASNEQAQRDYENVRLLLTAEVASDYYALRALDAELNVVRETIQLQREALQFVQTRHDFGVATGLDLAQQQSQLDNTITQLDSLEQQRAEFQHALATLTGTPAPGFIVAANPLLGKPPQFPVALPSDMLERRPDVASAERAMAAANAQIGIAEAAFYPSVMLSPLVGLESASISTLINASSFFWSFGVSAVQSLFDAGRNRANLAFAQAGYTATVESYRQTVLTAMQEVEDGLSGSAILERAEKNTDKAVNSSSRVLELATARYQGGIGTYLDVITAQANLAINQRQQVQILSQRFQMEIFLIKSLGGSW